MDKIKNDKYYIEKINKDLLFIIKHTDRLTKDAFENDEVLLDCIMFRLIQISENASKLTDSFKSANSSIPWYAIKGLRNRIVHDYGEVDYGIIFDTVKNDIPALHELILKTTT